MKAAIYIRVATARQLDSDLFNDWFNKTDTLDNVAPEQKNQKTDSPKQSKPAKGGTPSNKSKSIGAKKPGKSAGQSKQA